jgi:hypothetical protein
MKIENKKQILVALLSVVALVLTGGTLVLAQDDTAEDSISSSNYIYIEEFELSPGVIPNEAIAEAQDWVKGYRKTGEYKSVRLFIHNTGPRFALYLILQNNGDYLLLLIF